MAKKEADDDGGAERWLVVAAEKVEGSFVHEVTARWAREVDSHCGSKSLFDCLQFDDEAEATKKLQGIVLVNVTDGACKISELKRREFSSARILVSSLRCVQRLTQERRNSESCRSYPARCPKPNRCSS